MKFLLVVALVAGVYADAEAEADAQFIYGGVHSPLVYGLGAHHAVAHLPVVKSVEVTPAEVKTTPVVYSHVAGYPYAGVYGHHLGYGYGLYGHGLPLTVAAAAPAVETPAVEVEARKKREADAEADPEADPWYLSYGYNHPLVYTAPVVKPAEVKTVEATKPVVYTHGYHPYTYGAYPYTHGAYPHTYGAYPYTYGAYPYANTYGFPYAVAKPVVAAEEPAVEVAERKKREAEAEADPAVLASYTTVKQPALTYAAHPYAGLPYAAHHGVYSGYTGYPYAGVYGHGLGYGGLGYGVQYGK